MATVFALTGGVAAGKSTVAAEFAALGAAVIDADAVGHEALKDESVKSAITTEFGTGVLDARGTIDRKALGAIVFGKPERVKTLEAITHPWIRAQTRGRLDAMKRDPAVAAIVLDVSLLLESGAYAKDIDVLLFIDSDAADRASRAEAARQWAPGEVTRRETHQLPLDQKRARAHEVIDNRGSIDGLRRQVRAVWDKYLPDTPRSKDDKPPPDAGGAGRRGRPPG